MSVKILVHVSMLQPYVADGLVEQNTLFETRGWMIVKDDLCAIPHHIVGRSELYYGDEGEKDRLNLLGAREWFENTVPHFTLEDLGKRFRDAYIEINGYDEWVSVGVRWLQVFSHTDNDEMLEYFGFGRMVDAVKYVISESIGSVHFLKDGQTFLTELGDFATIRATDLNVAGEGYDILASIRNADGVDFIEWYKRTNITNGILNSDSGNPGLSIVLCTAGVENPYDK